MKYERLTERDEYGNADIIDANKDYDQYELLKEFVEWEKSKIEKVCIKLLGTGEYFDYAEAFGMECISNTLLIDLENFLKERENAQ